MNFQCTLSRLQEPATISNRSLPEKFQSSSDVTLCRWAIISRRIFFMFSVKRCKNNSSNATSHARGLKLGYRRCENSRSHRRNGFCLISLFARSVGDQFPHWKAVRRHLSATTCAIHLILAFILASHDRKT